MLKKKDINRPSLTEILLENDAVAISFTKATTGTHRKLICSLKNIPTNHLKTLKSILGGGGAPETLVVWDVLNGGWRSFRISSIISVDLPKNHQENKKKKEKEVD